MRRHGIDNLYHHACVVIAGGGQTELDLLTKKLFTEGRPGAERGVDDKLKNVLEYFRREG